MTKGAGGWNQGCSFNDNYATGPNPVRFCAIAGFESMRHYLPSQAALLPPEQVLSLVMPSVLRRESGEVLCINETIKLYESAEVRNGTLTNQHCVRNAFRFNVSCIFFLCTHVGCRSIPLLPHCGDVAPLGVVTVTQSAQLALHV